MCIVHDTLNPPIKKEIGLLNARNCFNAKEVEINFS